MSQKNKRLSPTLVPAPAPTRSLRPWQVGALLVGACLVAYGLAPWLLSCLLNSWFPSPANQPFWTHALWDDSELILRNPVMGSWDGFRDIWASARLLDYFPVTYSFWWFQWQLFGTDPIGYHVVNVLLHGANSFLWWAVLTRLGVRGAFFMALLFALHPVNAASVAWIAEGKNTLALLFLLLALLAYLAAETPPRVRFYWLAVGLFALALLSKTAVVALPCVLLLLAWWRRGRLTRPDLLRSVPFFVLSGLLGLVTIWFQLHRVVGEIPVHHRSLAARTVTASWALGFYFLKALLPVNLTMVYPLWSPDYRDLVTYLPLVAMVALLAVLLWKHRTWGRQVLVPLGVFVLMTAPILGFINMVYHRYSYVADQWQYFGIMGIIVLLVSLGVYVHDRWAQYRHTVLLVGALWTCGLGVLTVRQAWLFAGPERMWDENTVLYPECWVAWNNHGAEIVKHPGDPRIRALRLQQAVRSFEKAHDLMPAEHDICYDLTLAQIELAKATQDWPEWYRRHALPEWLLQARARYPHESLYPVLAAMLYRHYGDLPRAAAEYRTAATLAPESAGIRIQFALLLLEIRQWPAALDEARTAVALAPKASYAWETLAVAYAASGRFPEAADAEEKAIQYIFNPHPDYLRQMHATLAALRAGRLPQSPMPPSAPPSLTPPR